MHKSFKVRDLWMEESVYSSITKDKDKTFKVRDLWVEKSVYSSITRDKDKAFKVRDLWDGRVCVQQHN